MVAQFDTSVFCLLKIKLFESFVSISKLTSIVVPGCCSCSVSALAQFASLALWS